MCMYLRTTHISDARRNHNNRIYDRFSDMFRLRESAVLMVWWAATKKADATTANRTTSVTTQGIAPFVFCACHERNSQFSFSYGELENLNSVQTPRPELRDVNSAGDGP